MQHKVEERSNFDTGAKLRGLGRSLLSRVDFGLVVILALPWALLSTGSDWVLGYVGGRNFIDPWVYLGFFLDLPGHLKAFPGTYYGSRLSWILPGYVVYRIFPPVIAAYVLHLGVFYAALLSLYFTLKQAVSQRAALLSAVLMGTYGYFLWAVRWDYVDGIGMAYFLLTTLAMTYASKSERSWVCLVLGGAFYAAMIYSQLFLVAFTPVLLLYYVAATYKTGRHSFWLDALSFGFGYLALTTLLGTINYIIGGDFLFFLPSTRVAMELLGKPNPWKQPFQTWWYRATWLILPGFVFFSSLAFLSLIRTFKSDGKRRFLILFQAYFLACAFILACFQLTGTPVLQYSFYASFLIPGAFLALGAQVAGPIDCLNSRDFGIVLCATLGILVLQYRFPPNAVLTTWVSSHPWSLLSVFVLTGVALVLFGGAKVRTLGLSAVAYLALGVININNDHFRSAEASMHRQGFNAIVQSVQVIRSLEPSHRLLFWYQLNESMGGFYLSISSTYLWGYSLINERFPSLGPGGVDYQLPTENARVVVLSEESDAFQKAALALRRMGFGARLVAERRIQDGSIAWNMVFIQVLKLADY